MATNSRLLNIEQSSDLSIVNPTNSQVLLLQVDNYHVAGIGGFDRGPFSGTLPAIDFSPNNVAIRRGLRTDPTSFKWQYQFDLRLTEDELTMLWAIWESFIVRASSRTGHPWVTLRDRRNLFQELGSTNTRFLAEGSVDNTTLPGSVQYWAGFSLFFPQKPKIFNPGASSIGVGNNIRLPNDTYTTGRDGPQYRVRFQMIEGEKLEP